MTDDEDPRLKILEEHGFIQRRTDARQNPVEHRYEITILGIEALMHIVRVKNWSNQLFDIDMSAFGIEIPPEYRKILLPDNQDETEGRT